MSLREAINDLIEHVREDDSIPYESERRERFDDLDVPVWVEVCRAGLDDKLPPKRGETIGKTNLPGAWLIGGHFIAMSVDGWAKELLALAALAESAPKAEAGEQSQEPHAHRLTVDLPAKTITLDEEYYDVGSDNALRWVKVLAEHSDDWISGTDPKKYDRELEYERTDRFKKHLPEEILSLIDSETGKGSRICLRRK